MNEDIFEGFLHQFGEINEKKVNEICNKLFNDSRLEENENRFSVILGKYTFPSGNKSCFLKKFNNAKKIDDSFFQFDFTDIGNNHVYMLVPVYSINFINGLNFSKETPYVEFPISDIKFSQEDLDSPFDVWHDVFGRTIKMCKYELEKREYTKKENKPVSKKDEIISFLLDFQKDSKGKIFDVLINEEKKYSSYSTYESNLLDFSIENLDYCSVNFVSRNGQKYRVRIYYDNYDYWVMREGNKYTIVEKSENYERVIKFRIYN